MYADRISDNNALIQNGYFEDSSTADHHLYASRPDRPDRYSMLNTPLHLASAPASRSASLYPDLNNVSPNHRHNDHHHHQHHPHTAHRRPPNHHSSSATHHLPAAYPTGRRLGHTATRTIAITTRREPTPPVLYEYRLYENSFDDQHFDSPLALAAADPYAPHVGTAHATPYRSHYAANITASSYAGPADHYLSTTGGSHHHQYAARRQPLGQDAATASGQQLYRSYNHYYSSQHNSAGDSAQTQHYDYGPQAPHYTGSDGHTAYDCGGYPVKMQCEQVIIERSQLVAVESHHANGRITAAHHNAVHNGHGRHGSRCGLLSPNYTTQIITALAVSLGPLAAGMNKGYASPAIYNLQKNDSRSSSFPVSDDQASWLASLSMLGALFGCMFGGHAMQYGRRRLLVCISLPFTLTWIITFFAQNVVTLYATSFLGGFFCAIVSMVTQVYISEISSPEIRGSLSAIQKIAGHLGIIVSFSMGAFLDWRRLALLVSLAPLMLFLTVIYVPETPSFLMLKQREDEAYHALQWLRGRHANVALELDNLRANVHAKRLSAGRFAPPLQSQGGGGGGGGLVSRASLDVLYANIKSVLRNAQLVRPILITCGLIVFQRFTGAHAFNFYAVNIFSKTLMGFDPHVVAICVCFAQLLASMVSGLLIDIVGRIPLLIISSVFMSLALACFGSFVFYHKDMEATASAYNWIPLLCVMVLMVAFSLGISPISSLLVAELFPLEYRGVGSSITTGFSYFCGFISVKTYINFSEALGLHGTLWLYACISCLGLIFVVLFVPETKGKELEELGQNHVRTLTINR